jgi:hypothetical protein
MVPVMPAQAGIHDFGRIDPQERLWVTPNGRWYQTRSRALASTIFGSSRLLLVTAHLKKRRNKGVCQWFIQSVCRHLAPELTSMVADSEYFSVMVPKPDMAAYEDPNAPHELRILNTLQDKPQKVVKDPGSSKSCPTVPFQIQSPEFKDKVNDLSVFICIARVTTIPLKSVDR